MLVDPPYDVYPELEPMLHVLSDDALLVVGRGARTLSRSSSRPLAGTARQADPLRSDHGDLLRTTGDLRLVDVIGRAAAIFDRVVVGVVGNRSTSALFSLEERVEFLKEALAIMSLEVESSRSSWRVRRQVGGKATSEGLRVISD